MSTSGSRRILRGERVADHIADIVSDEADFIDSQPVENSSEIAPLLYLPVTTVGMGR